MKGIAMTALLALTSLCVQAQLRVPVQSARPVTDASMLIMDRGSQLEILPESRAIPQGRADGMTVRHRVIHTATSAVISPRQLGVVFNHSMQQEGYFTGEIAIKLRAGEQADGLPQQPLVLKQLGKTDVYVVTARNPREFVSLLKSLVSRPTLEWVEPVIIYGPSE